MRRLLRIIYIAPLLWLPLLLIGCGGGKGGGVVGGGDTLVFRHATLLSAVRTDSFTAVTVADPWHDGAPAA
ncbi:MAG: hypothetical protein J6M53_05880, partial [Bacteroidaceae bacterium]|nr:hypothetical protein [Bacteroidaceae bacterium]